MASGFIFSDDVKGVIGVFLVSDYYQSLKINGWMLTLFTFKIHKIHCLGHHSFGVDKEIKKFSQILHIGLMAPLDYIRFLQLQK